MRPWKLILACFLASTALVTACDTSNPGGKNADAGTLPDGGTSLDGGLTPCLEHPTELTKAPNGQLPCELLPPDFKPAR